MVIILGGLVDPNDYEELRTLDVDRVSGPETKTSEVTAYLDSRTKRPERRHRRGIGCRRHAVSRTTRWDSRSEPAVHG